MPVMFKPARSVKIDLWRHNANTAPQPDGSLYHIEIEIDVDEDVNPVTINSMAELRKKFGQEACTWSGAGGKVFVLNRDLEWDRAEGDVPVVLGILVEE